MTETTRTETVSIGYDVLFDLIFSARVGGPDSGREVLVVPLLVPAVLMTVWGRVGDWQPPAEAITRINVLRTVGSFGAALGDVPSDGDPPRPKSDGDATARQPLNRRILT